MLRELAAIGYRDRTRQRRRIEKVGLLVPGNGLVDTPLHFGVPIWGKDEQGRRVRVGYQVILADEATLTELEWIVEALRAEAHKKDDEADAIEQEYIPLMRQFPQACTLGEACDLAGVLRPSQRSRA